MCLAEECDILWGNLGEMVGLVLEGFGGGGLFVFNRERSWYLRKCLWGGGGGVGSVCWGGPKGSSGCGEQSKGSSAML